VQEANEPSAHSATTTKSETIQTDKQFMKTKAVISSALLILFVATARGQRASTPAEIRQAETDVPRLAEVLGLKPGMSVADVGAGFGAMTIVMAKWVGPAGR